MLRPRQSLLYTASQEKERGCGELRFVAAVFPGRPCGADKAAPSERVQFLLTSCLAGASLGALVLAGCALSSKRSEAPLTPPEVINPGTPRPATKTLDHSLPVAGNELGLAVPRAALGPTSGAAVALDFKWCDNPQRPGDITDTYLSGDAAPDGRFHFR